MAKHYDETITDPDEFLDDACEGLAVYVQDLVDGINERRLRGIDLALENLRDALDAIRERYEELKEWEEVGKDEDDQVPN
jgi:hypothetical protein